MNADFKLKPIRDKVIEDAIGPERIIKVNDMIRSVKLWTNNEMLTILKRYSTVPVRKEVNLKNTIWDAERMTQFLLIIYQISFPSALIGDSNVANLMSWITGQQMASEKTKKGKVVYPPLLKYRFINWLKHLSCEREKRHVVQRVTNQVVEYMYSIVNFCFKTIRRKDSTAFVPKQQFRYLEQLCFDDYEKRCALKPVHEDKSNFDLKILAVGSTLRPIVMDPTKSKEKRRRDKLHLAALLYHATRFGISSQTLAQCAKKIADFSTKSKDQIFYLKSDVFKFFPSIDQKELITLLSNVVQGECVVMTLECDKIVNGRKFLLVKHRAGADLAEAKAALEATFNGRTPVMINKKFTPTNVSRKSLMNILVSEIRHTVKYKGQVYKVGRGVGQGCMFSSLLGDIYLHERMRRIAPINPRDALLLCYADDFILLSHLRHIVAKFHDGILQEDMGIRGSREKTITNLNDDDRRILHWCGLTFHTARFALIKKKKK